jgi:hypothetical protein
MRCLSRPSRPTARLNRSTSRESWSSCEMTWLKAPAICAATPSQSDGNRTEKSPSRNANIAASICLDRASEPSWADLLTWADLARSGFGFRADLFKFGIIVFGMGVWRYNLLKGRHLRPCLPLFIRPLIGPEGFEDRYPKIGPRTDPSLALKKRSVRSRGCRR